jgi:holo-[acyl-carrier protein] synthase
VISVGTDLVEIARFRAALARRPAMASRIFSDTERASLSSRRDPVPGLAARFAAKEAAMKALGVGLGAFPFADVEVVRLPSGAPQLQLRGKAAALAEASGLSALSVSLSHTGATAAAVVVASPGAPAR